MQKDRALERRIRVSLSILVVFLISATAVRSNLILSDDSVQLDDAPLTRFSYDESSATAD